jgi:hypothetical protein
MRRSRRGADLLLQVRCAVYNGPFGFGFGICLSHHPIRSKNHHWSFNPPKFWTLPAVSQPHMQHLPSSTESEAEARYLTTPVPPSLTAAQIDGAGRSVAVRRSVTNRLQIGILQQNIQSTLLHSLELFSMDGLDLLTRVSNAPGRRSHLRPKRRAVVVLGMHRSGNCQDFCVRGGCWSRPHWAIDCNG